MENKYRCLTCYATLTKDEYQRHKAEGHVTLEYVVYDHLESREEEPYGNTSSSGYTSPDNR